MNKLFKSSRQHIPQFKNKFKIIVTLQNLNIARLLDFTFEFKIQHSPNFFYRRRYQKIRNPYDAALVFTLLIANFITRKVSRDSRSSTILLYFPSMKQMGIERGQLKPFNTITFFASINILVLLVSGFTIKRCRWMWIQMSSLIAISTLASACFLAFI